MNTKGNKRGFQIENVIFILKENLYCFKRNAGETSAMLHKLLFKESKMLFNKLVEKVIEF